MRATRRASALFRFAALKGGNIVGWKEHRHGIIGSGFARSTQLPAFAACEGARVVAIASGRRENAERVAREFSIPHVADDWRGVVGREDVDLVSIVTPPFTHAEMTLGALAAGKAVLCEKPTAMNSQEAELMRDAALASGLFARLDHELRFVPARRRMREMILAGELGRVWHARVRFSAGWRAAAEKGWGLVVGRRGGRRHARRHRLTRRRFAPLGVGHARRARLLLAGRARLGTDGPGDGRAAPRDGRRRGRPAPAFRGRRDVCGRDRLRLALDGRGGRGRARRRSLRPARGFAY
jgi:hypothetical protein